MKLVTCVFLLLADVSSAMITVSPNVLEYPLAIIEYLMSKHIGTFECVIWDIAPNSPILSELMHEPILRYVPKYLVQKSYSSELLLKNVPLLGLHPGSSNELKPYVDSKGIYHFLFLFNPATTVFVFWEIQDVDVFSRLRSVLVQCKYNNVLFFDTSSLTVVLSSVAVWFRQLFITTPQVGRVLVPRGRPFNAVEIMVMPFDWQVWTMLVLVLVSAEVAKRFMPEVFKNDPIMLVVCGFERYNLHQAGRWEKIVLQSLIILMFCITNAFDTKFISLMVDKPSAPSAQKLEDFDKYGLKFRYNLESLPEAVNNPIIGKYLVNGLKIELFETIPGFAEYITQDMADLVPKVSYDFERGLTWFVVLEERFFDDAIVFHQVAFRSQYMEVFRFTHDALDESGIMSL